MGGTVGAEIGIAAAVEGVIVRRSSCTTATVVAHGAEVAVRSLSRASLSLAEAATALVIASRLLGGFDVRFCRRCVSATVPGAYALFAETALHACLCCKTGGSEDI